MAYRKRRQNLFFLAGWLFADLFIVLSVIFIASTTFAAPKDKGVPPTPTPTPIVNKAALRPTSIDLTVKVDANRLLAHDPAAMAQVEQQVGDQLRQKGATQLTAGIVLIFGAGPSAGQDDKIAGATQGVLLSMGERQHHFFNQQTVFKTFIDLDNPRGVINISIYVFDR